MDERQKELSDLNTYIERIDKELTNILENLEWDRRYLLESKNLEVCKNDPNHKIPPAKKEVHEKKCLLKIYGYMDGEMLLPDLPGKNSMTHVKLGKEEIAQIINTASHKDSTFKRVVKVIFYMGIHSALSNGPEPMTLERLQCAYTADERRAIHDAVVAAAPACHDLSDLALLRTNDEDQKAPKAKSRMEVLAELRDMKRRRTKYRVAAKTRNYSDVLRDVIQTQMEIYHNKEPQNDIASNTIIVDKNNTSNNKTDSVAEASYKEKEEFSRDSHRCKSKEQVRDASRSRYKYTERHRDEGRSNQTSKETYNDVSRDVYNYDRVCKDSEVKYRSKVKEEFRQRSYNERRYKDERDRSRSNFRSEGVVKNEKLSKSPEDKRYGHYSRVKPRKRSEEKKIESHHRVRNDFSGYDAKTAHGESSHRRYYDAFDKEDTSYERRKRQK